MIITHKIKMDLSRRGPLPKIDAVQGDALTRQIQLEFYSNGTAWEVPDGVSAVVRFVKPDGTGGIYDTLPDGAAAYTIEGNTVSVILAPEVTTVSGAVFLAVTLIQGDAELSSFALTIHVQHNPNATVEGGVQSITLSTLVKNAVEAHMEENPVSGGLNATASALLIEILEAGVYSSNVTGKIASLKEALASGGDSGGDEPVAPDEPDEPVADDISVSAGIMTIISVGSEITVSDGVMAIA